MSVAGRAQHGVGAKIGVGGALAAAGAIGLGTPRVWAQFDVECRGADGEVKWTEWARNLVTNAGLNDVLNNYFKGSSYTAAWYVGLKGAGTIAAGDTLASHGGWAEISDYTGDRKALVLGTVASQSVDNSASKATFAIDDTATVAGAFVATAESGTSGVLYGVANFTTPRDVENGDTLTVTVTLSAADDS